MTTTIVIIVVVAFFGIIFLKSVKIVEVPDGDPHESARSAAARERVYGEARLKKRADLAVDHSPKAKRLWERAKPRIDQIVALARSRGLEVLEEELGVQIGGKTEQLFVHVDVTGPDPVFLLWTEAFDSGASSGLQRIRQVRVVGEKSEEWIGKQS